MQSGFKTAAVAALLTGSAAFVTPANADGVSVGVGVGGVGVGVGVGGPAPEYYYGSGYYPPGPCGSYNYYYQGDCGYPVYTGDVVIDGNVVTGPHYYRWDSDHPSFWYRGGWHEWNDWHHSNWNWDHRGTYRP